MRRPISDDMFDSQFEGLLAGAQRSLFRFEQQPAYAIDDEEGLFAAWQRGMGLDPTQVPGLRAWFAQVRDQTRRGIYIDRVRIVDDPITEYQGWLQFVDKWNRDAGEEISYLPRWAIRPGSALLGLGPTDRPFENCDWWLIDDQLAVIMHIDPAGVRTKVETVDHGEELVGAIQFAHRAPRAARWLERQQRQQQTPRAA